MSPDLSLHSLEGATVPEKSKSLNAFISRLEHDFSSKEALDAFISSITPQNKLEEVFKMDILIKFGRHDLLLDVLKGGNALLIGKLLKYWKFFEETFQTIDERTLVDDVLPHTSYSTRMKIITRLSTNLKSEEKADAYFQAIEGKYGLQVARGILPACSLTLVKSVVKAFALKLSSRQLQKIVKKHRDFLPYYFEVVYEADVSFDFSKEYGQVLKRLAKVDADLFWLLFDKYHLKVKFGKRMTPYIYAGKKDVIKDKEKLDCFSAKKIYDAIKQDERNIRALLVDMFPKKVDDFYNEYSYSQSKLRNFAECVPKSQRYEVLDACFRQAYAKNLRDHPKDMPEDILKIIPVKDRETLVDDLVAKDESWVYMYGAEKSVPLITDRVKHTSNINQRSQLVTSLCRTCRFNEDADALLGVFRYIRSRHKNDGRILLDFMYELSNWPHLEKLSDEHWTHINNFLKILQVSSRPFYNEVTFMMAYLIHLIENNQSRDDFFKSLLKHMKESRGYCQLYTNRPKYEKLCYEQFGLLIPQIYKDDKNYDETCISILLIMTQHNKENPKYRINIFDYPELLEIAKAKLSSDKYHNAQIVLHYCILFEQEGDDSYDRLFWEYYEKAFDINVLCWYVENRPQKVAANIDVILKHASLLPVATRRLYRILRSLSMLSFTGVTEKIIGFALEALHNEDYATANFAVAALSFLTTEQKYFDATKPFYPPEDGKIDFEKVEEKHVTLQESVIKGLTNLEESYRCLPLLLKFCVGEYLKYSLKSLYHVVSCTPEVKLVGFFESLFKSAVSVRKHAVSLVTTVETKEKIHGFLQAAGQSDRNASLQKVIFKSTLRYFAANPNQNFWDLLKANIKIIDENDVEAFALLLDLKKIHAAYLSQYVPFVYDVLASNKDKETRKKKHELLSVTHSRIVDSLSEEFLKRAITESLFAPDGGQTDFSLKCVFNCAGAKLDAVFATIFDNLKAYVDLNRPDFIYTKARTVIYSFLHEFCCKAIALKATASLVNRFVESWRSTLPDEERLCEENLLLAFTRAYVNCQSENKLVEFGGKANEIFIEWLEACDASVVHVFAEEICSFVKMRLDIAKEEEELFAFVDAFVCKRRSPYVYIGIMNLLFKCVSWSTIKSRYSALLAHMRECDVPSVQFHLIRCLKTVDFDV